MFTVGKTRTISDANEREEETQQRRCRERETHQLVNSSFNNESSNITRESMNYCSNHATADCKLR